LLRRLPLLPILLTLGLLAARVLRAAPLTDPLGGKLPPGVHLGFPATNLIFAPLFDLWDGVSMLSMSRLTGFATGLLVLYVVWRVIQAARRKRVDPDAGPPIGLIRETASLFLALAGLAGFVAAGLLWHRPMVSLRGAPDGVMVVDFHSHTSASHDVKGTLMKGFDAEANRRWHGRAGFDAAFITDHNTIEGFPNSFDSRVPLLCPGIEVSAWRAHIVLPGAQEKVNRGLYADSIGGTLQLLQESEKKYGAPSLASLPEYERNHWSRLTVLIAAGLDGFEIVNASPKANEMSRVRRDSVIALARTHHLFLVGVSDSHGWGATSMVWNLVPIPGWKNIGPEVCTRIVSRLESGGPEAVQIIERHRLRADSGWPRVLTPIGVVWETWRGLNLPQAASWLAWIWVLGILAAYRRKV
jgi:hypothetical protein